MSRGYDLTVRVKGLYLDELRKVVCEKLGWDEQDNFETENECLIVCNGRLHGGQSEEEAHEEIKKLILEINAKVLVCTTWTYLEELPNDSYGDCELLNQI